VSKYLTPAVCAARCSYVEGATYIGVQAGRKCFCGNSFGRHGESNLCAEPCDGDEDQVCGAHNVNSIYTFLPPGEVDLSPFNQAASDDQEHVCEEGRCGCFLDPSMIDSKLMEKTSLLSGRMVVDRCVSTYVPYKLLARWLHEHSWAVIGRSSRVALKHQHGKNVTAQLPAIR